MTHYRSDDTWPRHQKPHWNSVLVKARKAGWTLTYLNAPHTFGYVLCPSGECTFMVDKTARSAEAAALRAGKTIERCRHAAVADAARRAAQKRSERLLNTADRLVASANAGLTMAETHRNAWEKLDSIETQLLTAAATAVRALRAEEEATWEAAIGSDAAPSLDSISATLDDATETATQGRSEADAFKITSLADRARACLRLIDIHRRRLEDLRRDP